MKRIFMLLLIISFWHVAQCQITYSVNSIPYQPFPFETGILIDSFADDNFSKKIPIGFSFNYFGNVYDTIIIGSNGSINFDKSQTQAFCPWATSGTVMPNNSLEFNNSILFPFHDLNIYNSISSGKIRTISVGTAPYRRFIVSIDSSIMFQCVNMFASQQVVLYESPNYIDINIKEKPICSTWNAGVAHLGIQNANGSAAFSVPGKNGTQWTATNESWRFFPSNAPPINPVYCKVKGNIFLDTNYNCIKDANESGFMSQIVQTDVGNYFGVSDSNGDYEMMVDTGNYTILHYPLGFVSSSCLSANNYNVYLANIGDSIVNINFADSAHLCADLASIAATSHLKDCASNLVTVNYGNLAAYYANNVILTVTIPSNTVAYNFSTPPISQIGNTITFNIGGLNPGQFSYISFEDSVICNAGMLGTIGCLSSSITSGISDCDSSNNSFNSCYSIVASFDPNQIQASVSHIPNSPFVNHGIFVNDEWVTYKVDFQNTGTASAFNIRVEDFIDDNLLDTNTVTFLGSSHQCSMIQMGNLLNFNFYGINLLDSNSNEPLSHGWLLFKVKTKQNISNFVTISNSAGIFFDNNAVVNTNVCELKNYIPEWVNEVSENSLNIFPNPMFETLSISLNGKNLNGKLWLYDMFGNIIFENKLSGASYQFQRNNLNSGIYMLKYIDESGSVFRKKIMLK